MVFLFLYLGIIVAVGALLCFKGRDLFYPAMAVLAFFIGFGLSLGLIGSETRTGLIISLIAGLAAALAVGFIFRLCVFISALFAGYMLGGMAASVLSFSWEYARLLISLGIAVLIAVLALKWLDFFISFSTAATGASMMAVPCCFMVFYLRDLGNFAGRDLAVTVARLNHALMGTFPQQQTLIMAAVALVLMVIGMVIQMKTNKKITKRH